MNDSNVIYADPFLSNECKSAGLPDNCYFVCAYSLLIGTIPFEEAVFFRRTETTDELWVATDDDILSSIIPIVSGIFVDKDPAAEKKLDFDCVMAAESNDDEPAPWISLLDRLTRSRTGLCRPKKFLAAGLADKSDFGIMLSQIFDDTHKDARKATEPKMKIIRIESEPGLSHIHPEINPELWQISCSDKNHLLFINTSRCSARCG